MAKFALIFFLVAAFFGGVRQVQADSLNVAPGYVILHNHGAGDGRRQSPSFSTRANVNVFDKKRGNTLLHLAIRKGDLETFDLLITAGAKLNSSNKEGNTPLHDAVRLRKTDFIRALIAAGVDPSRKNKKKDTPLHLAIKKNYTEAVEDLIAAGADLNAQDKNRLTPFYLALKKNNKEIIGIFKEILRDSADHEGEVPL